MKSVSSSAEFEVVPIRRHEDVILRRLYDRLPVKIDQPISVGFNCRRIADQKLILEKVLNLLSACVDVMSSNAWLSALGAMDLAQMYSPRRQVPHLEPEVIKRCTAAGIESVYDIMEMEDDKRTELLQMSTAQMQDVAAFVNSYPTLDVSYELVKDDFASSPPDF
ncbi:Sec63-domain-containing protein [Hymenopellis radicata]|nr:Sec63-domain-containing protein [Hymenopellis radicata]